MKRIGLLALIFAVVSVGVVFGYDDDSDFDSMPKNTITVDVGPTIIGLSWYKMGEFIGESSIDMKAFGIGAQYERQLQEKVGVGFRFAYLSLGIGLSDEGVKATSEFSSFSLEGHIRYYPDANVFFLDGMLGYGNLALKMSGEQRTEKDGIKKVEKVSYTLPRDYFKFGGKIGWRVDFGDPGGFVFEPSLGYYFGLGLGDPIQKKMVKEIGGSEDAEFGGLGPAFYYLENVIFIGGPRVSLSFGWRF
jgi:hypothetical protein